MQSDGCIHRSGSSWPQLVFEVSSVDKWQRHRVEGYGFADLPRNPGSFDVQIRTWRPTGSLTMQMQNHFIGGAVQLKDLQYVARPFDRNTPLNRFGLASESSGTLAIRFSTVFQRTPRASSRADGRSTHRSANLLRQAAGVRLPTSKPFKSRDVADALAVSAP